MTSTKKLSRGGRYYRTHAAQERGRKESRRATYAGGVVGFLNEHPDYSDRWHPIPVHISTTDDRVLRYRLTAKEDRDWRAFLREHKWDVGEKGRDKRIRAHRPDRPIAPLNPDLDAARERFHEEALNRTRGTYQSIYHPTEKTNAAQGPRGTESERPSARPKYRRTTRVSTGVGR
jgi:hypothetical protein